ncbi:MAG: glycogen debranching N-terminal domain-containing protein [Propionibacteriaceae bacterium]
MTSPAPCAAGRQPLLHDAVLALAAPTQVWSGPDGELGARAVDGVYHGDTRVLSGIDVQVGGGEPELIAHGATGAGDVWFDLVLRGLDGDQPDPRVRLRWERHVDAGRVQEDLIFSSGLALPVQTEVSALLVPDGASMPVVKAGAAAPGPVRMAPGADHQLGWTAGSVHVELHAPGAELVASSAATLRWPITIPAAGSVRIGWALELSDDEAVVAPATAPPQWADVLVSGADNRLSRWVQRALGDLTALRLTTVERPSEVFLGAGAPWFLTLFGRDAIWAARFLLPLGTELAGGTLRTLAALQGRREDAETAEQPGKIMHELRAAAAVYRGGGIHLPPRYYGTVDATPLWIILLCEAWTWGLPPAEVADLLDPLESALAWLRDFGDSDGDGFLEYVDAGGRGLTNQGWKDSADAVQFRDGRLASGPIALCEVQGYAHHAARAGADLLEAFGRPAGPWREWAARLSEQFAARFWVEDDRGRYPAVALDADKTPVDSLTSNIGHLLGTGLLTDAESRLVAERLVSPQLTSGYGLHTLATDSAGYWPLSYHGGTVWTHDTAIAISGLRRAGFSTEAGVLIEGLLAAAEGFGYRMPELHAGDAAAAGRPVPYPAACRPQAWSAAAAVSVLTDVLGLHPDPGSGRLLADPLPSAGAVRVEGIRWRGQSGRVDSDAWFPTR